MNHVSWPTEQHKLCMVLCLLGCYSHSGTHQQSHGELVKSHVSLCASYVPLCTSNVSVCTSHVSLCASYVPLCTSHVSVCTSHVSVCTSQASEQCMCRADTLHACHQVCAKLIKLVCLVVGRHAVICEKGNARLLGRVCGVQRRTRRVCTEISDPIFSENDGV